VTESNTLSVTAEALHLPEHLEVSIEGLEAGSRVTAADVTLPTGTELAAEPELVIAVISVAPSAEQLEGEVAEAAEAAEGAEEQPAEAAQG
jgi:large subunit ribosomal protein L25